MGSRSQPWAAWPNRSDRRAIRLKSVKPQAEGTEGHDGRSGPSLIYLVGETGQYMMHKTAVTTSLSESVPGICT